MSLEGIARTKEALELLGDSGGLRPLRVSELQALREKAPSDEALGLLLSGPLSLVFFIHCGANLRLSGSGGLTAF